MDSKLLELLVCPVTKGPLDYVRLPSSTGAAPASEELISRSARLAYPVRDGIPILLEYEARAVSVEELDQCLSAPRWFESRFAPLLFAMSTLPFTALIPARLASTRLPNKPLALIDDLPMVVQVARRAQASAAQRVVVATDSAAVMQACQAHAVEAVMTRADHLSGSDRLAEACGLLGLPDQACVVNVQGDEPLIDPALINAVAALLAQDPDASMSTAAHAIHDEAEFLNPNVVKVVLDARSRALYFSRAPIAFARSSVTGTGWASVPAPLRHVGIYGYRVGFLRQFPALPPAPIEHSEALEQLRALWHGYRIAVHVSAKAPGPGVDTADDLQRVRQLVAGQRNIAAA